VETTSPISDTLGRRSRICGASFVGGVWKGNPDPPTGIPIAGADGGGGGTAPSGPPKIDPANGTLGRRSRGGGGAFVGGVWKGNPDATAGAGMGGADGGGDAPSGVPKGKPVGGTLGKRSRGGGASFVDGVWKGNPDELSGAGIDARGADGADGGGAGTGTLAGALACARGAGAANSDVGGILGKRSRAGEVSLGVSEVWKGNTDELFSAAKRWRTDAGSSGTCAVGRNGRADSVEGGVSGISVFPTLTRAPDGGAAGFANGNGESVATGFAGLGTGLAWIAVTSSSSARKFN